MPVISNSNMADARNSHAGATLASVLHPPRLVYGKIIDFGKIPIFGFEMVNEVRGRFDNVV